MDGLDSYDKKLLYELDKDSHISLSNLSKKLKRSKQFIKYRIKRLEDENIIAGYTAIVDMSKLGYFTFRVYFKFQQTNEEKAKEFVKHVRENLSQVWTITSMRGKWDYALFLGVKNILEFHKIWEDIMLKYKNKIKRYNVALYAPIHNFNRTFFFKENAEIVHRIYGAGEKEEIDETDWKLIEAYAKNVRQSSLEISKKIGVSADTVRRRVKDLEKRKIIVGYKIDLNLEELGYAGYRVDLELTSTKRNKELFEYCKQNKNIYQINQSIGGADFELEVIVDDLNHLIRFIDDLKKEFKDVINDVDYFGFSIFHILQYIPD